MNKLQSNVNKFRENIRKNKGNSYPIINTNLLDSSEYIKNMYIKMLCVIVQYGEEITEEQNLFIQRIIKGANVETSHEDYMRQAIDVKYNFFEEFINQTKDITLKYNFVVDSMIAINLSNKDISSQIEFLAELFETMTIKKYELEYMSVIVKSILEQNKDVYKKVLDEKSNIIHSKLYKLFLEYTKSYAEILSNTQQELHIFNYDKKGIDLSLLVEELKQNEIIIENAIISLGKNQKFVGCTNIEFKNCEVDGNIINMPLNFLSCKNIKFTNCTFKNFKTMVVETELCSSLEFHNCYFCDCHFYYISSYNWPVLGEVINNHGLVAGIINNCTFKNCGGVDYSGESRYINIISGSINKVTNSKFINCWHYNNAKIPDINKRDLKEKLFMSDTENVNNEIIGSAKFS